MHAADRDSLRAALERLGSPDDAEALAAARTVHAIAAREGIDWDDLLPEAPGAAADDTPDEGAAALAGGDGDGDGGDADGGEEPDEGEAAGPVPGGAEDDRKLVDRLLARAELSAETLQELQDMKQALAAGGLDEMDRRYLRALAARLRG